MTTPTSQLAPGDEVLTTGVDGDDFGLPLVSPTRDFYAHTDVRMVRSVVRKSGGVVVRFMDGTKTRPVSGRVGWISR